MADVPAWRVQGDWFDVCNCSIPCPCTFAQAPSEGDCEGILAWHIKEGTYGDVHLDGLNVVALGTFTGNIWAGEAKPVMGMYMDERADERQRDALHTIFGGEGGGWPGQFANLIDEVRGIEYVPITFEIADDLAYWSAEVPGKASARAEALTGPTTPPEDGFRCTTLPVRRSVLARSLPGVRRPSTTPTVLGSSGSGTAVQASTFPLTGAAPTNECV